MQKAEIASKIKFYGGICTEDNRFLATTELDSGMRRNPERSWKNKARMGEGKKRYQNRTRVPKVSFKIEATVGARQGEI